MPSDHAPSSTTSPLCIRATTGKVQSRRRVLTRELPFRQKGLFPFAGYIYGWNFWQGQFYNEFQRTGGEYSLYLGYAARQVNDYYQLVVQNNC